MRIMVYCQHVLGIGHLSRMAVILREMTRHRIHLVLGGPEAEIVFPDSVVIHRLEGLCMDAGFSGLRPTQEGRDLEEIKSGRRLRLVRLAEQIRPDLLLVELFPFGRCSFRFELDPLLDHVRRRLPGCRVVSSVRDILVEREQAGKFEERALERLNRFFDLVLVHGDPRVIRLEETFPCLDRVRVPVRYTGYVAERAAPDAGRKLRRQTGLAPEEKLVVVSAGSGSVGRELLEAALAAQRMLWSSRPLTLRLFTGPYLAEKELADLQTQAGPGAVVERFSSCFPDWLAAADLSLSLGGYNTTMNVAAAGCPGLFLPFAQNREQRLRLERLCPLLPFRILEQGELEPRTLATLMTGMLDRRGKSDAVDLGGASGTARLLEEVGP